MLNTLRSKQKAILWVTVVIVGSAFVFFGVGGGGAPGSQQKKVAEVNGEKLSYEDFNYSYNQLYKKQIEMYEKYMGYVNSKMRENLGNRIKSQVLNELINKELLIQKAAEIGLYVSVDEIKSVIQQNPYFQENGTFNEKKWNEWINNVPENSLAKYERNIREQIMVNKMVSNLRNRVSVSDKEIKDYYLNKNKKISFNYAVAEIDDYYSKVNATESNLKEYYNVKKENYRVPQKVDISYVVVNPYQLLRNYDVPDKEAEAYYDSNKKKYQKEEEVKIQYVKVNIADYLDRVSVSNQDIRNYYTNHREEFETGKRIQFNLSYINSERYLDDIDVTEKEVKEYYQKNKEDFKIKAQARAKHIIFRTSENETKNKEKRAQAKDVLRRLKEGEDFEKLARKYSEGPTKAKGGDLGYFTRGEMVKEFDQIVFEDLDIGDISGVVESRFGYHIIKLIDKNEMHYAGYTNDESVYKSIEEKVKKQKAITILKENKEQIDDMIVQNGDFNNIVREHNMEKEQTEYLTKKEFMNEIVKDIKIASDLYNLENRKMKTVIANNRLYLFSPVDIQQNYVKKLNNSEVVNTIKEKVKKQKAFDLAEEKISKYHEEFKIVGVENFQKKANELNLKTYPTGFFEFSRNTFIPGIGKNRNALSTAFGLEYTDISKPVKIDDGFILMRLVNRRSGYIPSYNEASHEVKRDLKLAKARENLDNIVSNLKKKVKKEGFDNSLVNKYNLKKMEKNGITREKFDFLRINDNEKKTDLIKKIYKSDKGNIIDFVWGENIAYLIKVEDNKDSYIKELKEIKNELEKEYKFNKAKEIAMKDIKNKSFSKVESASVKKGSENFSKEELNNIADSVLDNKYLIERKNSIVYVKNIKIIKESFDKLSDKKISSIKDELIKQKNNEYLKKWFKKQREESDIRIYLN